MLTSGGCWGHTIWFTSFLFSSNRSVASWICIVMFLHSVVCILHDIVIKNCILMLLHTCFTFAVTCVWLLHCLLLTAEQQAFQWNNLRAVSLWRPHWLWPAGPPTLLFMTFHIYRFTVHCSNSHQGCNTTMGSTVSAESVSIVTLIFKCRR